MQEDANNAHVTDEARESRDAGAAAHAEREAVDSDPAFQEWRDRLPSFELDNERLFLPTGDIPMDESQLADYWRRLKASPPRDADPRT